MEVVNTFSFAARAQSVGILFWTPKAFGKLHMNEGMLVRFENNIHNKLSSSGDFRNGSRYHAELSHMW
jgi:hypothetical protein